MCLLLYSLTSPPICVPIAVSAYCCFVLFGIIRLPGHDLLSIAWLIVVSIIFHISARIRILNPQPLSPNDGPRHCSNTRRRRSRGRCGCRKTPIARQMPLGEHSILTSHLRCRKRTQNGVRRTRLRKPGGLVGKYTHHSTLPIHVGDVSNPIVRESYEVDRPIMHF